MTGIILPKGQEKRGPPERNPRFSFPWRLCGRQMDSLIPDPSVRVNSSIAAANAGSRSVGETVAEYMDRGSRRTKNVRDLLEDQEQGHDWKYRVRSPTRSERLNRALKELRPSAFKLHQLIWTWRGAPARGTLPYFTIRSLEVFCALTRPTVREAFKELTTKGWIQRLPYNCHHKNTLYKLTAIRKVPPPNEKR